MKPEIDMMKLIKYDEQEKLGIGSEMAIHIQEVRKNIDEMNARKFYGNWLILIRALISWVSPDPFNHIVQFLDKTTEPILYPIRKLLPFSLRFGIDISPIIAFFAIMFLRSFLVRTLLDLAARL